VRQAVSTIHTESIFSWGTIKGLGGPQRSDAGAEQQQKIT